nr:lysozyme inhibitor LprI family protein [Burkholderia sp. RF4-BP95]
MRVLTGLLCALALTANVAHAQANCADATDQAAMTACADRAYKKSDADLNRTYQAVTARLRDAKPLAEKLVNAQRAWIATATPNAASPARTPKAAACIRWSCRPASTI